MQKRTTKRRAVKRQPAKKTGGQGKNYEITGVILFLFSVFILFSLFQGNTGFIGDICSKGTHFLLGMGAPFGALLMMFFGGRYAVTSKGISLSRRLVLIILLVLLLLMAIHHFCVPFGHEMEIHGILTYGGIIGASLCSFMHDAIGDLGTTLFLIGAIVIDVLLLTHWSLSAGAQKVGDKAQVIGKKTGQKLGDAAQRIREKKAALDAARSAARLETLDDKPTEFIYKKNTETPEAVPEEEVETPTEEGEETDNKTEIREDTPISSAYEPSEEEISAPEEISDVEEDMNNKEEPLESIPEEGEEIPLPEEEVPEEEPSLPETPTEDPMPVEEPSLSQEVEPTQPVQTVVENAAPAPTVSAPEKPVVPPTPMPPAYQFPPLSLLHAGTNQASGQSDVRQKAALIESTLHSFGVKAKVVHFSMGPTVTRFELKPEMGVRVSKIEGLSNELAMALEATHIRIEAPIPGKSAVGIEIPNTKALSVPLHDVLASDEFQHGKGHILVALGKDITGKTVVTDLAKAPHLLIAGSTGSGKSVCINSIITSIIYHSRPDEVKLMLIDPKVVELSVYNGIPHLRTEVVTDMRKAQGTLNWAVREMEARYQLFAGAKVRNIEGYNKANPDKKMPYILIIVDEFADLMNVAAKEVEVLIQRLTQKARAAGIHLILATQRPSADVITGVIKSNIPSRIAFMVESGLNSRIILDEGGAESLLGKGDMLFKQAGALSTVRIQGAFISDEEVESVVEYVKNECLKQEQQPVVYEPIDLSVPDKEETQEHMEEEQDDLLPEAAEWVLDTKRASVSALQRRFRIGYTRAGRLMDTMERMGIVGPAEGAKPRDILMSKAALQALLNPAEEKSEENQ